MKRCSSGKKSFKTERDAWKAVIEFNVSGASVGDVYYHRECRRFHLTSQRDNRPYWVRRAVQQRLRQRKTAKTFQRYRSRRERTLSREELRAVLATMERRPKRSWWRRLLRLR